MAFHMLQTIYTIYGTMLKWGQILVDWKRLSPSKVCDSFKLCRKSLFLMLDKLDRLVWDIFLYENRMIIETKVNSTNNASNYLFMLVDDYLTYLKTNGGNKTDDRRRYMFYFILMARKFMQFWYAMRRGY